MLVHHIKYLEDTESISLEIKYAATSLHFCDGFSKQNRKNQKKHEVKCFFVFSHPLISRNFPAIAAHSQDMRLSRVSLPDQDDYGLATPRHNAASVLTVKPHSGHAV